VGLPNSTVIEDLTFAALSKEFCLAVEIDEGARNGLDRVHRTDSGTAEGTADALCEFCAAFVIQKCYYYIIVSFTDKIELAFKGNPIMMRRKSAVSSVRYTVPDLPV
jgi:hypothetical protein